MDADRWERIKRTFGEAVDLPPHARASYLDAACDGDASLRAEVEFMLRMDRQSPDFLESPLPAMFDALALGTDGQDAAEPELPPGTVAGQFTIEGLIARGGMGAVYRARQASPDRPVALKVLGGVYVSGTAARRFALESQALARLQHPGIAQIIETGEVEVQRAGGPHRIPYFAMELVEGVPITERAVGADIPARLELLAQVCDAVEHAHQRGVIHRDLKPANILVDASDRPRVLDFGVARLTHSDARTTIVTGGTSLIGTLPYMSPEQVGGDPIDVDTRSDVYALGVIACEVLTGRLPYQRRPATIVDAVELIARAAPVRPSRVNPSLRGDLDAVLLGALEKDRARRYQSAGAFASDLRRVSRREPVSIKPQTTAYLLRAFARRHRPLVAAAAAGVLALGLGGAAAAWEAIRATRAEREARQHVLQIERTANALLEEVYTAVFALPGSADARLKLTQQAVALMDELAAAAPEDPKIQSTLANGWRKLAGTYGTPGNANLGDRARAIECYDKAIAIIERVRARDPAAFGPTESLTGYLEGRANAARTLADRMSDLDRAVAVLEDMQPAVNGLSPDEQSLFFRRLARLLTVRASYGADPARRSADAHRGVKILSDLREARALSPQETRELAMAYRYLADVIADASPSESAAAARSVMATLEPLADDQETKFTRCVHGGAARILLGRLVAARGWDQPHVDSARGAVEGLESLLSEDLIDDFRARLVAESLPDYARMWLTLATHTGVDAERRIGAARAGDAAAARGLTLWSRLRDHDQLGPGDDDLEGTLRSCAAEFARLLRADP